MSNENPGWYGELSRDKQKLMLEVAQKAREMVEDLKARNFQNGEGINLRIKREFNWSEFAPRGSDGKILLTKTEILSALGIDFRNRDKDRSEGSGWSWPTNVPDLIYFFEEAIGPDSYDYFKIVEGLGVESVKTKTESLAEENKRMWEQPDADKKANKEITEDMANYDENRNN